MHRTASLIIVCSKVHKNVLTLTSVQHNMYCLLIYIFIWWLTIASIIGQVTEQSNTNDVARGQFSMISYRKCSIGLQFNFKWLSFNRYW